MKKPPVVLLSGVRWDFLWQRHQALATLFARAGYPTVFVETTGLSDPGFGSARRVLERLLRPGESRKPPEDGALTVYSPFTAPPTKGLFRRANRRLFLPKVARDLLEISGEPPVVFAYPPTRTTLDLLDLLKPRLLFYDCADEYASFPGVPRDVAGTERDLLLRADLVSCTSEHLLRRVRRLRPDAFLSGPGVDYDLFAPLSTEEVSGEARVVCYFGSLDAGRVDFEVLRAVVRAGFELRLVGRAKGAPRSLLRSPGVDFRGEVPHRELPVALAGLDAFLLPYELNDLTLGVSPAKTFECLATGKPVVAAPLPAVERLSKFVYLAREPEDYVETLKSLGESETREKVRERREVALRNSWEERFKEIEEAVWRKLDGG